MDIHAATDRYETWLAEFGPLFPPDLDRKHRAMADPGTPFPFLRATYYRWPHHWRAVAGPLAGAPRVLAVGDLHIENFGLWRDTDGRLCWGVNDFDEADELPYTSDLVRLAVSARTARTVGGWDVKPKEAAAAILAGYRTGLSVKGGDPFVLEERHPELRALAYEGDTPAEFWEKVDKTFRREWPGEVPLPPAKAKAALRADLPATTGVEYRPRLKVGMGSLGRARYMARVQVAGGWLAREAKRVAPPATAWDAGTDAPSRMAELAAVAIRSPDPFFRPGPDWATRRLAPKAIRIDFDRLRRADHRLTVLHSMGAETANVHLGTPGKSAAIRKHLDALPADWLHTAAKAMEATVLTDWTDWRSRNGG